MYAQVANLIQIELDREQVDGARSMILYQFADGSGTVEAAVSALG